MNKCQLFLVLFVGIQIGVRLPSAKKGAEQFKNSVGSKIVEHAAIVISQQINSAVFSAHKTTQDLGKEK